MMKKFVLVGLLALTVALSGCPSAKTPDQPATPAASWDTITYQTLISVQAALNGAKAQAAALPQFKTQINQAITAYNAAEAAFKLYETGAKNPADQSVINQQISAVASQVTALVVSIEAGVKK